MVGCARWNIFSETRRLSEEGKTFVVAAGEAFQLLHVNSLDEMAQSTPAISDDRLLVRTESKLYSIRRAK